MGIVKLKDDVNFDVLLDYGFVKDPANCEPGDHYYHLNNYYIQIGDFRVTVNMINRNVDILCLARDKELYNMFYLEPLYNLFASGLVEIIK